MSSDGQLSEVCTLEGHSAACWSVCFHPTSPLIASCSSDKSIRIWRFNKSLAPASFHHANTYPSAHNKTIRQVVFSPDGRRMASASFDSTVGIWERSAGQEDGSDDERDDIHAEEWENVGSLEGHESEVKAVAWSHDGSLLATCGRDKSVWVWDANTPDEDFECLAVLMDHTQDVKHVTFSPTEELLASSSYDDTVKLYAADYATDEWMVTHSLPPPPPKNYNFPGEEKEPEPDESNTGHSSTVWASSFSPDGNYLASCSDDKTIKIWARFKRKGVKGEPGGAFRIGRTEKEGWYCAATLRGYHNRTIFSIDWTEAGNWEPNLADGEIALGRLASTAGDGRICVFGIIARPDESQRSGFSIEHTLLAKVEQGHEVYDINNVQWCRLGSKSTSASDTKPPPANRWQPPPANRWQPPPKDEATDEADEEMQTDNSTELWQPARDLLATAGDDGSVKVWRFQWSQGKGKDLEGTHAPSPMQIA